MNKRILEIRKDAGKTQDVFAEKLGLTKNFISLIETGKREPSDRTIKDICREFNINEDWLRTGKGEMKKDIDMDFSSICAEIGIKDEKAKVAIMKYYELSDDDKKLWWKFMERFIK